jgi:5,5'-dehydrodivanillate O-demethylase
MENDTWTSSAPLVFPNTHVTSGSGRHTFGWRVPMDDMHTMQVILRVFEPGPKVAVPKQDVIPYMELPVRDDAGRYQSLETVNGQDFMVWAAQDEIMERTAERLGDTDRGIILYRQLLKDQVKVVAEGGTPINVFRDPLANARLDLPVPWDRGYAWGFAKDGSYTRGAVTAGDNLPPRVAAEIEELYVAAARA